MIELKIIESEGVSYNLVKRIIFCNIFKTEQSEPFEGAIILMKNYILDTNVSYTMPKSFKFGEHQHNNSDSLLGTIILKEGTETGHARQASCHLDDLRQRASVTSGIKLDNGGLLLLK